MKNKTGAVGKFSEGPRREPEFSDPVSKPWVWVGFILLFAGLIPVWPIAGFWWGIPAWAVFAVAVSAATSVFTAFVILRVWKDTGKPGLGRDDVGN
jgi:fatty acid desaturase